MFNSLVYHHFDQQGCVWAILFDNSHLNLGDRWVYSLDSVSKLRSGDHFEKLIIFLNHLNWGWPVFVCTNKCVVCHWSWPILTTYGWKNRWTWYGSLSKSGPSAPQLRRSGRATPLHVTTKCSRLAGTFLPAAKSAFCHAVGRFEPYPRHRVHHLTTLRGEIYAHEPKDTVCFPIWTTGHDMWHKHNKSNFCTCSGSASQADCRTGYGPKARPKPLANHKV